VGDPNASAPLPGVGWLLFNAKEDGMAYQAPILKGHVWSFGTHRPETSS
jgi:hypothetical protein